MNRILEKFMAEKPEEAEKAKEEMLIQEKIYKEEIEKNKKDAEIKKQKDLDELYKDDYLDQYPKRD